MGSPHQQRGWKNYAPIKPPPRLGSGHQSAQPSAGQNCLQVGDPRQGPPTPVLGCSVSTSFLPRRRMLASSTEATEPPRPGTREPSPPLGGTDHSLGAGAAQRKDPHQVSPPAARRNPPGSQQPVRAAWKPPRISSPPTSRHSASNTKMYNLTFNISIPDRN